MTSYVTPKKGVEFIFYAGLPSVASTSIFQSTPTIAAGDFKVSIDGGALANLATLPAVTPGSSKMVKFTLSTSEMNGDNITVVGSDAAGGEWKDIIVNIQTSARQIDDLCYPTTSGRSLDVTATGAAGIDWNNIENPTTTVAFTGTTIATTQKVDVETIKTNPVVNGGTITFPTGATLASTTNITAGTVTTATNVTTVNGLAANVITAASMAADASAEIADAVWDEDATGHQTGGTFGQAIGDPGADTTTIYQSVVTDAAGANVAADIIAMKTDTAAILVDTGTTLDGRIPAALVGGRMDASVGAMAANTLTAAATASDFGDEMAGAIWNATTATYGAAGSYGLLIETNLDGTVTSRASQTSLDTVDDFLDTEVAAIKAKTDQLTFTTANQVDSQPISIAANAVTASALASDAANEIADALLDRSAGVETNRTLRQAMRLMLSAMVGKVSGAATATNTFRDTNDTVNRIVSTVDADGNRSAVTLDAS